MELKQLNNNEPVLQMKHISKSFFGTKALDDVSMTMNAGEIRAVVGPNGAGKSTLMKILRGAYRPTQGEVVLQGASVRPRNPSEAGELGIAMVYQELSVLPDLDVAENIMLASAAKGKTGLLDRSRLYADAQGLIDRLGIDLPLRRVCSDLTVGQRQMVEILRALSGEAKVLICDEPTAALSKPEQRRLMTLLRRLRDTGVGILYVTHHLDEVFDLADSVTVIRDGRNVATAAVAELDTRTLVALILGEAADTTPTRSTRQISDSAAPAALEVRGLCSPAGNLTDIDLAVRPGEIVGLAGTLGSGCSELVRCLYGAAVISEGQILVKGKNVTVTSPRQALAAGIRLVPGDRKTQGIFPGQTLWNNIVAGSLGLFTAPTGLLHRKHAVDTTASKAAGVGVKASSMTQEIDSLSGGNQQKAILARWLLGSPPAVLLLDDPTVGVDVGAKREIRLLLDQLANSGVAVLLVSSEFDELANTCDRVLVLQGGRIVETIDADNADEHSLLVAATGGDS